MTWEDAAKVAAHPALARFVEQCRDDNPDVGQRDAARATVIRLAGGEPKYPPALTMAGNLAGAVAGFVASGFAAAGTDERARRLAICHACPEFDDGPGRCRVCGCVASLKARIAGSACPIGRW